MDMFDGIIECFDSISNDPSGWSRDATVEAVALCKCLLDFEVIIALHIVERYMSYIESLNCDWIYGNRSKSHIGNYEIIDFKDFNAL